MAGRTARVIAVLLAILLAGGCTRVVVGGVRAAPGLIPHPLTGHTIDRALLDNSELSKMFREAFEPEPHSQPRFGGPDQLFDSKSLPSDCVGVVFVLEKSVYQSSDVNSVAYEGWRIANGPQHTVISVEEGVAALPSAAEANRLFAEFTGQWNRCQGATVKDAILGDVLNFSYEISDVRAADTVLLATVESGGGVLGVTLTDVRAVGVRVNCLVEVKVAVFSDYPGDPQTTALGVARAMMDKVSTLS